MATTDPSRARRFALPELSDERTEDSIAAFLDGPRRRTPDDTAGSPLSALASRLDWQEALRRESNRVRRYRRPASVVALTARPAVGTGASGAPASIEGWPARVAGPIAHVLRRGTRSSDLVARTGEVRFQLLLPETSEPEAALLTERLVADCEVWLTAIGAPLVVDAAVVPLTADLPPDDAVTRAWAMLDRAALD